MKSCIIILLIYTVLPSAIFSMKRFSGKQLSPLEQSTKWLESKGFKESQIPEWPISREKLYTKIWVSINKQSEQKKNELATEIEANIIDTKWHLKHRLLACLVVLGLNPVKSDMLCSFYNSALQKGDADFLHFLLHEPSVATLFELPCPRNSLSSNDSTRKERRIGKFLLHHAMGACYKADLVQWCIDHRYDPNEQNLEGESPLDRLIVTAAAQPKDEVKQKLELLLTAGAKILQKNNREKTVIDSAQGLYESNKNQSLLLLIQLLQIKQQELEGV